MGARYGSVSSTTFVGPLPASAAETVVLTSPAFSPPVDAAQVQLLWSCQITAGTGTTALVFRLRRGTSVSGALVFAAGWTLTLAAGNNGIGSGVYVDSPGVIGGQQYSLTVVQTAASGAGTFVDGCLLLFAL